MKIKYLFLFLFIFFVAGCSAKAIFLKKTVYGDGIFYYSWLHSIIIDHDIDFRNEYHYFDVEQQTTPTGLLGNVYAVGPALFWTPSYLFIHEIFRGDGFWFPYQLMIGLTNVGFAFVGILLLFRLLLRYFDEHISLLTTLGIAIATNLFFYGSLDTVNSHALSFLLATVVFTRILEKRSLFVTGVTIGFMSLIRSQDALFLLFFLPSLLPVSLKKYREGIKNIGSAGAGFILGFSPQLLTWQLLYGNATRSPYLDSYHFFDWFHPKIIETLLSPNNGVLLWTPIIALCIIGFFLKKFPSTIPKNRMLLLFFAELYLIASWSFWWQGSSFSGRMFISLLPIFAFGLASVVSSLTKPFQVFLISCCSLLNIVAMIFFLLKN